MQVVTIALTTVPTMVTVLIGILINNHRLGDMNMSIHRRIDDVKDTLRAEMARNHSEMLMKFAELDQRVTSLETRLDRVETRLDRLETRLDHIEHSLGIKG
ncbi:MAG: hypothetical protein HY235_16800 [Acidobacteria bacterium]|nr:hypothetical protein [Acidobacteriota bacterium]